MLVYEENYFEINDLIFVALCECAVGLVIKLPVTSVLRIAHANRRVIETAWLCATRSNWKENVKCLLDYCTDDCIEYRLKTQRNKKNNKLENEYEY